MNRLLSLQAASTAPVMLMSQNPQAERDRLEANDDLVDQAAEEIRAILDHLAAQDRPLVEIHALLGGGSAEGTA